MILDYFRLVKDSKGSDTMVYRLCGTTWTFYHVSVFLLTFFAYAFFHATRKTFSNVKATISDEWTPAPDILYNDTFHNGTISQPTLPHDVWTSRHMYSDKKSAEYFLGALDTTFLISYAVGLYISGIVGDRLNMRLVLTFGMCSSAVVVFFFGCVSGWAGFYHQYYYVILMILNGLLQSTGWPTVVAVMANWFGKSTRGFVFGLWSACASVGNIIGAFLVTAVLQYGYEYAFLVPSAVLFGGGVVIFFGLVPSPSDIGLESPDHGIQQDKEQEPLLAEEKESESQPRAIGFFQAFRLPGVALYSLCYACLKMVNYAFFFWLPFYLTNQFNWSQSSADDVSIWYDVGGIIGGTLGGIISDRMSKRSPTVMFMLLCAIPALYIYSVSPNNKEINAFLMAVVGFFTGGAANIISSAITADLGKQDSILGDTKALATVTGIIDGTGSVGAAIGQFLVPIIQLRLDWHWVFYFFILMTVLTMACILPLFIQDVRSMSCWQRRFGAAQLEIVYDDVPPNPSQSDSPSTYGATIQNTS